MIQSDIQRMAETFSDLDNVSREASDEFKNHNWRAWLLLPATKCFMNWILLERLVFRNVIFDMGMHKENNSENFHKWLYSTLGADDALSRLIEKINYEIESREIVKEGEDLDEKG